MLKPSCLTESQALDAFLGSASHDATLREERRRHIDECRRCAVLMAEAARTSDDRKEKTLLVPGERIGNRYVTVRFLARGGMGEVWEVHDLELNQRIALKTLAAATADDARAVGRLKEELLLARQVSHPNVCRLLEFGVWEAPAGRAIPFLTMELLSGETLGERLRRQGPLSVGDVRSLMEQLLGGLAAIHAANIVHRDVKSDNIFLVPQARGADRVVVTDLGLARPLLPDAPRFVETGGYVVGTLNYMAPEQIEGSAPSPAFDVYAAGMVLYESLTGTLPFTGETLFAAALKKLSERPRPPSALREDIPREWDAAILRCLERDPARRFASVAEVQAALLGGRGVRAGARRMHRAAVRGGLAAAVAASILGLWMKDRAPAVPTLSIAGPTPRPAVAERKLMMSAAVSPPVHAEPGPSAPPKAEVRKKAARPSTAERSVPRKRAEPMAGTSLTDVAEPAAIPPSAAPPEMSASEPELTGGAPAAPAAIPLEAGGAPILRDPDDVVNPFRRRR